MGAVGRDRNGGALDAEQRRRLGSAQPVDEDRPGDLPLASGQVREELPEEGCEPVDELVDRRIAAHDRDALAASRGDRKALARRDERRSAALRGGTRPGVDIATNDDDGSQYLIWLSSLDVRPAAANGSRGKVSLGETLTMKGHCFAEKSPLQHYNLFHAALRHSDFFRDFASLDDPSGKAVEFDDKMKPSTAWAMDLTLNMKGRDAKAKPADGGAHQTAEAPKPK